MVDAMLVLLFAFMLFMLLVKEDSPMRQVSPIGHYLTLKDREKAEDEDKFIDDTETEMQSEAETKPKLDTSSTSFLVVACFLLLIVGCCVEAFLNGQLTDPNN